MTKGSRAHLESSPPGISTTSVHLSKALNPISCFRWNSDFIVSDGNVKVEDPKGLKVKSYKKKIIIISQCSHNSQTGRFCLGSIGKNSFVIMVNMFTTKICGLFLLTNKQKHAVVTRHFKMLCHHTHISILCENLTVKYSRYS